MRRASYTKPVTIAQLIHLPGGGTEVRPLPASVLDGQAGLKRFVRVTVTNATGTVIAGSASRSARTCSTRSGLLPTARPPRLSRSSAAHRDPFQLSNAWGIQKGWGVDPFEFSNQSYRLKLGTYQVTATITSKYRKLLNIPAADATAHVTAIVVKGTGCCEGPRRRHGTSGRAGPLPRLPKAKTMKNPPRDVLPDLTPAPSWGITVGHTRKTKTSPARDELDFGATVWIGGSGPL